MMTWLQRLGERFGGRPPAAAPVAASDAPQRSPQPRTAHVRHQAPAAPSEPVRVATPSTSLPLGEAPADLQQPLFEWMLGSRVAPDAPTTSHEQKLLVQLDMVIRSATARNALLPRAPALIPQLLGSLRDEARSTGSLAQLVAKDPLLVTEVTRLASSAQARGDAGGAASLAQAIERIGSSGLRRAIARVLLRPIFDARTDPLSARAAPRIWQHSEAKAEACMRLAAGAGLDPFEAYLAGLLHDIGWTAALRALASHEAGDAATPFSAEFVAQFEPRREALFAHLVMPWKLNDSLGALARELLGAPLAQARSPLGRTLAEAERLATLEVLDAASLMQPAAPVVELVDRPAALPGLLAA